VHVPVSTMQASNGDRVIQSSSAIFTHSLGKEEIEEDAFARD